MRNILFVVFLACTACGNIQVLPDGAIKNTIKASKEVYDDAKVKSSGGEKRTFSSMVKLSAYKTQQEAELACITGLKARTETESKAKPMQLISESTSFAEDSEDIIKCEVVAYIWP